MDIINTEATIFNIKKSLSVALNMLHHVEDLTNYDIKKLGKAIDLIRSIDIDKEFKKYYSLTIDNVMLP